MTERRLTPQVCSRPVEKGRNNNRLLYPDYGILAGKRPTPTIRKLFKKIRTKKRRAFRGIPAI